MLFNDSFIYLMNAVDIITDLMYLVRKTKNTKYLYVQINVIESLNTKYLYIFLKIY